MQENRCDSLRPGEPTEVTVYVQENRCDSLRPGEQTEVTVYVQENKLREPYDVVEGQSTAFACEGMQMTLRCSSGTSIDVVRVKYGRFSGTVCTTGETDHDGLTCFTEETTHIKNKCTHRQTCVIIVNGETFATDPCPAGVFKQAKVSYNCI
ncbi:hypothetical protein Btru_058599 [Bulinus truncatus]|nr:hypothetical protein Btru_058599 [Bulinus truncatus]